MTLPLGLLETRPKGALSPSMRVKPSETREVYWNLGIGGQEREIQNAQSCYQCHQSTETIGKMYVQKPKGHVSF